MAVHRKNWTRLITIALVGSLFLGFTGKEKFVQLTGSMNARSDAQFTQLNQNILFVLPPGTQGEILSHTRFPSSGNFGLQVRISSGPQRGKVVWLYYNNNAPTMRLDNLPEQAASTETVKPTPATAQPPEEIKVPQTETAANGVCAECAQKPADDSAPILADTAQSILEHSLQTPINGALRTMAAIYQSCEVLKKSPYNPAFNTAMGRILQSKNIDGVTVRVIPPQKLQQVVANHFYLKDYDQPFGAPQCMDMRKAPPLYHYAGRPQFHGNEVDLFQLRKTGGTPFVGIDCSAFISASLSVSGLKLTPGVTNAASNMTTSRALHSYDKNNSCFNRPQITKQSGIKSGDIIAYPGHTFMIDQVGQDPLGIEAAKRNGLFPRQASGCHEFEPPSETFNFSIIQSSGTGDFPAMRIRASDYRASLAEIRNLAVQACLAEFTSNFNPRNYIGTTLLRHKGVEDKRCVFSDDKKPSLRGEQCTGGCTQELAI